MSGTIEICTELAGYEGETSQRGTAILARQCINHLKSGVSMSTYKTKKEGGAFGLRVSPLSFEHCGGQPTPSSLDRGKN